MQYFQKFPPISYSMIESGDGVTARVNRTVPNMTVSLDMTIFDSAVMTYKKYRVTDADRPDTVAAIEYGASRYAWVILLANKMKDWYDWPLTNDEFYAYMNKKYETSPGANNGNDNSKSIIAEYWWQKDSDTAIQVDQGFYLGLPAEDRYAISVFDKEYDLNDKRREIRIPTLAELPNIVKQFERLVI